MFSMRKRPLVAGAVALAASGVSARLLGTVYRIFLVRIAGEEVLGLFQMTMPLYHLVIGLATMGLDVATTQLVADAVGRRRPKAAWGYIRLAIIFAAIASIGLALLLRFIAPLIASRFFGECRLRYAISSLGILLIPSTLCGVLRGSVQGWGGLSYVAAASLVEVILRVPIVLSLLSLMRPWGIDVAVAAIILGMVGGELGSLVILGRKLYVLAQTKSDSQSTRCLLKAWRFRDGKLLLSQGLPVMASRLLNSSMGVINAAMVPRQLMLAGLTQSQATQAFGQISGMVLPMLYMPMVLIVPVTQVVIPAVAERMAQNKLGAVGKLLRKAFLAAGSVAVISAAVFWFGSELLGRILYDAPHIAPLIRPLAVAAPFAFFGSVAGGTLYGLGYSGSVMVHVFFGNVVRFLLILHLVSNPMWGVYGAIWSLVADYAVTAILNLVSLAWHLRRSKSFHG